MKRLAIIEFLKGYSIFTIILFHYLQHVGLERPYSQFIFFGGTGVHLFILLSGLGLYLSYLRNPLPYGLYLRKRTGKIYFPYIVVVILSALISLAIPIYNNSLYALGGHVFLYKMFDERIMGSYGYPLWFISTILQFYLVFHILASLLRKLGNTGFLIVSLAISLGWMFLVLNIGMESERVWNSFFLRYLWEFSLGMVLADVLTKNNYQLPFRPTAWLILLAGIINCALYAFLAMKGGSVGKLINDIPALIGYSFVAVWLYLARINVVNRFFLFTGKISYSLYLLHFLILLLALSIETAVPIVARLAVALIATYVAAYFYHRVINPPRPRTLTTGKPVGSS